MALKRSHLTFTRSIGSGGRSRSAGFAYGFPPHFRTVVNHCIGEGACKPFRGATVGHFASL
jgi:hypothetical protein